MKRKLRKEVKAILAGLLVVASVFAFSACENKNVVDGGDENVVNPWKEIETIDEAIKEAGFTNFDLPETIDGKEKTYIAVLDSEFPEVEVIYGDDITIRKASTDGDISGDYNEYKVIEIHDGEGVSFQTKGDGQVINNVTWTLGEYAYSITSSAGLSIETVNELVSIIK